LQGGKAQKLSGRVLTAPAMNTHNTFDQPDAIKPADFSAFKTTGTGFTATLPAKSVVVLEVE
jgi:alpha-N-arabinofuranosidase